MKFKNKVKKIVWIFVILAFCIGLIMPLIMESSKNFKIVFVGHIIGLSFFSIVVFGLGISNLRIIKYKQEKPSVKISAKVLGTFLIILSIAFASMAVPYYKDLSNMMNSQYEAYDGQLKDFKVTKGRTTITRFTVGDKDFEFNGQYSKNFLIKGKKYHVEVLPNTNYVVSVYRY
ncbi:hypothetical protein [Clostridium folliculivorans]|uniref:Uncharacterized protein n=1 Tax=Clostridium folliculivorans TaxID=2886038 RepID=A0A9W5Y1U8_9CLOT|nr:hypothetical protein [Clostridium folliculivorans]GKU25046.1 hypothetical protein CFOLD11_18720 [Clostridium folliculivorans]GKU31144.1 hypothetical protein CFB3_32510 [Clostridium folliculivorans]